MLPRYTHTKINIFQIFFLTQIFHMTIHKLLIENHESGQMKTTVKFSNDHNLSFVSTTVQFLLSQITSCLENNKFLKAYMCYPLKIQCHFRALFFRLPPQMCF